MSLGRFLSATAVAWLLGSIPAAAQSLPPTRTSITPAKTYLMAFHSCEPAACSDPKNHTVYLAESDDGGNWSLVPGWVPYSGSVPDVIRRDDTLYVYTASPFVTRYNLQTGTLDRVTVTVTGLPGGSTSEWVDPSLYVDEENRLVLFLMYAPFGAGDPARCPTGVTSCTKRFLSATEVAGSAGTRFIVDDGDRATATLTSSGSSASDPDIFFDGRQYVMYMSHGPSVSVWTSPTLRGTFTMSTTLTDGLLSRQKGGVPAGYFDTPTAHYWTYAHVGEAGKSVIRRAGHPDFNQPIADASWATVLTASAVGLSATASVESPGFTTLNQATARSASPACAALTVPAPVVATVVGDAIRLIWGGVSGATRYVVDVGSPAGALSSTETGPDPWATLQARQAGTYTIRIRSRNGCSTSNASVEIRATIP